MVTRMEGWGGYLLRERKREVACRFFKICDDPTDGKSHLANFFFSSLWLLGLVQYIVIFFNGAKDVARICILDGTWNYSMIKDWIYIKALTCVVRKFLPSQKVRILPLILFHFLRL